ncbi:hypothetical protein B0H16DRAFT_1722906 [Mycena metata]|uniref:Uncharacterized protein n=1 Tax=Mycena metata TaxID=1033252 RepID=A0AAD7J2H2_9AGAR|nr:hypothetical protein B0H16DRAFT_1722906 [Mycena metata]
MIFAELTCPRRLLWFLCFSVAHTLIISLGLAVHITATQYLLLDGPFVDWLRSQSSSHQQPEDTLWTAFELLLENYRHWKSAQIKGFYQLFPGSKYALVAALKASLDIWINMPIFQKLLIIVPVILFYGHFYMMPVARSLSRPMLDEHLHYIRHRFPTRMTGDTPIRLLSLSSSYTRQQSRQCPATEIHLIPPGLAQVVSIDVYPPAARPPFYTPAGLAKIV